MDYTLRIFSVVVLMDFIKGCPVGFFGKNCTTPCRYPNFGERCQQVCNCTDEFCDNIVGCLADINHYSQDCVSGYYGLFCNLPCKHPQYGENCQRECNCNLLKCHHIKGCLDTAGCPDGIYETNCDIPCRHPNFGHGCQQNCNCTIEFCDFNKGCRTNKGCPSGFYGVKCRYHCRYPNYGVQCQSLCACESELCNHISGCNFSAELTTKRRVILHAKDTILERNVYILIGISVFVVVIILPICLFVSVKRRKSNMSIEEGHDDFVSEFSSYQSDDADIDQSASSIICQITLTRQIDHGIYGNNSF